MGEAAQVTEAKITSETTQIPQYNQATQTSDFTLTALRSPQPLPPPPSLTLLPPQAFYISPPPTPPPPKTLPTDLCCLTLRGKNSNSASVIYIFLLVLGNL
ncbi:hypothetical protein E2C01_043061 [Portunus trituberculatus]|uniref:Uncharacterized protein n=1 Tax=Portunus trituberculatus TaxID=210409 RepID=A0A5B7FW97_PORTR|nr:hypothetical protein [Portunus trituberculatus]